MSTVRKLTFSLPEETANNLDVISARLGVSRSGLVSELLAGACGDMMQIIDLMPTPPENGTKTDLVRLRGQSAAVLRQRLDELGDKVDAL